jgi:hypothetical protein
LTDSVADGALLRILRRLSDTGYDFVMPTLATHALVADRRRDALSGDLKDIFGWTRLFTTADIPADLLADMREADIVSGEDDQLRATMRVSRIEDRLHLHSANNGDDHAVFLGPDSYRFVRLLGALDGPAPRRAIDIGTGAGAGAMAVAARWPEAEVLGSDINPGALRVMSVNAQHAGLIITPLEGAGLDSAEGDFDLIVANPPFIAGRGGRVYRDGGGLYGAELAIDWVRAGIDRLSPGGRLVLYTGAPVVGGRNVVRDAVAAFAGDLDTTWDELDPDIFGGLLRRDDYRDVERIAAVGLVLRRP